MMEFKQLEIKPKGNWIKRTFASKHVKKSILFMILGAGAGFLYYYFTDGYKLDSMSFEGIGKSLLFGGFLGLFITNSPCTRGKC